MFTVDTQVHIWKDETPDRPWVPGERGRRTAKDRAVAGIPLGPKVWKELTGIAASLGVPVPDPLG